MLCLNNFYLQIYKIYFIVVAKNICCTMYIRFTKSKKSKNPTLQIIHGYREGKKVKQKVLASLGVIKNESDKVITSSQSEELDNCEQP